MTYNDAANSHVCATKTAYNVTNYSLSCATKLVSNAMADFHIYINISCSAH